MNLWLRNFILLAFMLATSCGAIALRPTHKLADDGSRMDLEAMIPDAFGQWHKENQSSAQIVDPQQRETIDKIYSQTLTRSYTNARGTRVMLSIAYGNDQSDALQLHYPEVCYPAQGFALLSSDPGVLDSGFGDIRVKRLQTQLGDRFEPVTYWSTLSGKVVRGGLETKLAQLQFGFGGQVPDGLLFRVSSITPDSPSAYATQQDFVRSLMATISKEDRLKLAGLSAGHGQR